MAHTPEECARRTLEGFQDFNIRAGECLMMGSFTNYFVSAPWRMDDFNIGANEGIRLGWMTAQTSNALFLTQAGEDEFA